jgi:hypothetical protein
MYINSRSHNSIAVFPKNLTPWRDSNPGLLSLMRSGLAGSFSYWNIFYILRKQAGLGSSGFASSGIVFWEFERYFVLCLSISPIKIVRNSVWIPDRYLGSFYVHWFF